eukprot:341615-Chlamydomonas_euryale.AAC.2
MHTHAHLDLLAVPLALDAAAKAVDLGGGVTEDLVQLALILLCLRLQVGIVVRALGVQAMNGRRAAAVPASPARRPAPWAVGPAHVHAAMRLRP